MAWLQNECGPPPHGELPPPGAAAVAGGSVGRSRAVSEDTEDSAVRMLWLIRSRFAYGCRQQPGCCSSHTTSRLARKGCTGLHATLSFIQSSHHIPNCAPLIQAEYYSDGLEGEKQDEPEGALGSARTPATSTAAAAAPALASSSGLGDAPPGLLRGKATAAAAPWAPPEPPSVSSALVSVGSPPGTAAASGDASAGGDVDAPHMQPQQPAADRQAPEQAKQQQPQPQHPEAPPLGFMPLPRAVALQVGSSHLPLAVHDPSMCKFLQSGAQLDWPCVAACCRLRRHLAIPPRTRLHFSP